MEINYPRWLPCGSSATTAFVPQGCDPVDSSLNSRLQACSDPSVHCCAVAATQVMCNGCGMDCCLTHNCARAQRCTTRCQSAAASQCHIRPSAHRHDSCCPPCLQSASWRRSAPSRGAPAASSSSTSTSTACSAPGRCGQRTQPTDASCRCLTYNHWRLQKPQGTDFSTRVWPVRGCARRRWSA